MKSLIQLKQTTAVFLVALGLACFGLSPAMQALSPAPDGGYPNFTTAEGDKALFTLTTGAGNTGLGWRSLFFNSTGSFNTGVGAGALLANAADRNTATGGGALLNNTTGGFNTANGAFALFSNTTASGNTAIGASALLHNTTGNNNVAIGITSLFSNALGSGNIALGPSAGANITGDNNIDIDSGGVVGESGTIRIGALQTKAFIAGIRDAATGNADAIPVLVDSAGQLGTASSSLRFKTDIKPMDTASESILALRPVTFHYKNDDTNRAEFGLIAEEVAKVNPNLIVRDKTGEIYTVRYDAVNAMLLNEFLKAHRKMEEQETTIAKQQKQIDALTRGLQKVSDQLEMSNSAPRTVLNNR